MVKVLKINLHMSNEKNFSKNFDGLTKEESERLLELERSLELAKAKAQEAPQVLRGSATHGWLRRWVSLLSKTGMDSFASTLVHGTARNIELWTSSTPFLGAVLC